MERILGFPIIVSFTLQCSLMNKQAEQCFICGLLTQFTFNLYFIQNNDQAWKVKKILDNQIPKNGYGKGMLFKLK